MLYDFHHNENNKKPNSVNATYILTGVQKAPEPATSANGFQSSADTDDIPPSSPYISSSMPNQDGDADEVAISSILLVREEDLEGEWCRRLAGRVWHGAWSYKLIMGARCQSNVPVYRLDICLQFTAYCAAGSQCLDGCGPGDTGQPCAGRPAGARVILGHDSEQERQGLCLFYVVILACCRSNALYVGVVEENWRSTTGTCTCTCTRQIGCTSEEAHGK